MREPALNEHNELVVVVVVGDVYAVHASCGDCWWRTCLTRKP